MKIRRLFISPGHNYFGHHGRLADKYPTVEVKEVECVAGRGLKGDRFFDFKENYKGQVTFFAQETFEALCSALKLNDKSPGASRRNIIVENMDLKALVGREFEIQGVKFLGTAECTPCHWMDEAFAPGAEHFLQRCGGLRAQILTDGILRVDS
jgi:MOSC domain-containing protein YiiM